jgi:hypothetical protein
MLPYDNTPRISTAKAHLIRAHAHALKMTVRGPTPLRQHDALHHKNIIQSPRQEHGTPELRIDAHLCWAASGGAVRVLEATRHTRHAHLTCTSITKHARRLRGSGGEMTRLPSDALQVCFGESHKHKRFCTRTRLSGLLIII